MATRKPADAVLGGEERAMFQTGIGILAIIGILGMAAMGFSHFGNAQLLTEEGRSLLNRYEAQMDIEVRDAEGNRNRLYLQACREACEGGWVAQVGGCTCARQGLAGPPETECSMWVEK